MSVVQAARRLAEQRPSHPVLSLYLDLDPEEFAAPPARVSQIHSLLDQAARDVEADDSLTHEELVAVREDLDRVREYLLSDEPPFQGARALAVFCSGRDDLFEVVQLSRPAPPRVAIERKPYVEPLIGRERERDALDRMAAGIGAGGRGAGGAEDVIAALAERRVQTLLLDQEFDRSGRRCPNCGLLSLQESGACPTGDGATLEPIDHVRE